MAITCGGGCKEITKAVPDWANSVEDAINGSQEIQTRYNNDRIIAEALNLAAQFVGRIRQPSTHAAGVVISPCPLSEIVPLQRIKNNIECLGCLLLQFLSCS